MRNLIISIFTILISINYSFAGQDCRQAVVDSYKLFKIDLAPDSFSSKEFTDFGLTTDQFNQLSSEEQDSIYLQIRPLKVMVEETIAMINSKLNRYLGTLYELIYEEKINNLRKSRENLRSCEL